MQSEPSQMAAEKRAADRSPPVTETGKPPHSVTQPLQAPVQELAPADARERYSANTHPRTSQYTNSRGGRGNRGGPRYFRNAPHRNRHYDDRDRGGEHIQDEADGGARDNHGNDSASPQAGDDPINHRSNHGSSYGRRGHHSGHRDSREHKHYEPRDPNSREDGEEDDEGEGDGGEEGAEGAEGETDQNQARHSFNPLRIFHKRESARDVILRLRHALKRQGNDVTVLSTRNEELSEEIKILKEEVARLQIERDQTNQLLQERTAELSSAQLFLGKADSTSVTDVSRMVDNLNAEISQASISIGDSLSYRQSASTSSDTAELNRLLNRGRQLIGARLCDILARCLIQPSVEFDPMVTQLALQAGLSHACRLIINDWNPPFWDSSSTVGRIYDDMRLTEGQVIAGRWRALARAYIKGPDSKAQDAKDGIREANEKYLRSILRDLLTIVGWSPRDPNQTLPPEYKEKIRLLSDKALKLHKTIGQGITSSDLIVETIPFETPFDPAKMDDADRQRGKPGVITDDVVACTVELGLKYKSAKPGGHQEESAVILKPKVLLASVLMEEDKGVKPPEALR